MPTPFDLGGGQHAHVRLALTAQNMWIPTTTATVKDGAGVTNSVLTALLAAAGSTGGFYMNPADRAEVWFEGLTASTGCCVQQYNAITAAWDDMFTWDPNSGERTKIVEGLTDMWRAGVKTGGFNAGDTTLAVNMRFVGAWNR